MKKVLYIVILIAGFGTLNSNSALSQTIDTAEYFFDTDPGVGNGNIYSLTSGDSISDSISISLTGLNPGFHNLFFRVKDTNNVWSLYEGGNFFITDTLQTFSATIDSAEYFFDTDPGAGNGLAASIVAADSTVDTVLIPTAGLSAGFHNLFVREQDTNNIWSLYEGGNFYLTDTLSTTSTSSAPLKRAEYFFDTDPGIGNGMAINNFTAADSILVTDTLPTSPLTGGTHYLFIRTMDTTNIWSLYDWKKFVICNFIPAPDFSADTVCLYSTTTFTDMTSNLDTNEIYSYAWDFNNDSITDDTTSGNTSYSFPSSGTHTVTLIVNSASGCIDTVIKTVYVDSIPAVSLTFPTDTICADDTLLLSGGNPAGGTYSGNGVYNGSFYADSVSQGNHTVTYTYYTSDSCVSTATDKIFVSYCLGLHEQSDDHYSVAINPNPFSETATLSIAASNITSDILFRLYDVFGAEVRNEFVSNNKSIISRKSLASGIYFYKISSEEKIIGTGTLVVID